MFFQKFASVITSTVVIALTYAMVYFICLCITLGPEGDTGSVDKLAEALKKKKEGDMNQSYSIS